MPSESLPRRGAGDLRRNLRPPQILTESVERTEAGDRLKPPAHPTNRLFATILISPISPVAEVCVPPQSSVENPSDSFTTRTLSPILFTEQRHCVRTRFTAVDGCAHLPAFRHLALPSTSRFTMDSISRVPHRHLRKVRKVEPQPIRMHRRPRLLHMRPRTWRSAACAGAFSVIARIELRRSPSTTVFTRSPTATPASARPCARALPATGSTHPVISATVALPSGEVNHPVSPT